MAKLTFYGAVTGVTGSAYLLETDKTRLLLECGLIQGSREEEKANDEPFPFQIDNIDAIVLSHAHLDHSGRIPKIVKDGYSGPIYMTHATRELLEIMLKDAAFLEERDTYWENKQRRRAGEPQISPLFTDEDVKAAISLCDGIDYGYRQKISDDITLCFYDAGHILGSTIVKLIINSENKEKILVFSGDLGNGCAALLRDPEVIKKADILLLESTYGDRNHRPMDQTLVELEDIITQASMDGGNILIPSFAVGRTQEIIFRLGELYQQGKLKHQAVYLDSPMAIATTEVYHRYQDVFNREDRAALRRSETGSLHTFLPVLRYSCTTDDSKALNRINKGAIIIAGSGMCNGGRIRHHFKHNLWKKNAHVIIVGYQAASTPGRALVDGAKTFRFGREEIAVRATIHTLGGFSAHADREQLLAWASNFNDPLPRLFLIHGEPKAKAALSKYFSESGWSPEIPNFAQTIKF